jgi:PPOX class probable F420-dependent enzyme
MPLNESQRAFLAEVHYAVIGTLNANGSIQQTVIWYLLEGDEMRFSMGAGSVKARNIHRTPTATITVADGVRYLSVSGDALVEPADNELRLRLARRYLGAEKAEAWLSRPSTVERASGRLRIRRAYGQKV